MLWRNVAGVFVARDARAQHVVLHALYVASQQYEPLRLHGTGTLRSQTGNRQIYRLDVLAVTSVLFVMVARFSFCDSEDHYIFCRCFFMFYVFRHQIFRHHSNDIFETLPHGVALAATQASLRLPLKCFLVRKINDGAKLPNFVHVRAEPPYT